jgi:hypothetical protein
MDADLPEITAEAAEFCTECGQALPAPGDARPSCPQLDARRRDIVARYRNQLDELRTVDAVENAQALRDAAAAGAALAPVQEGPGRWRPPSRRRSPRNAPRLTACARPRTNYARPSGPRSARSGTRRARRGSARH